MAIIVFIVFGLLVGLVARLLVPGRDPIGLIGTILLGIAGSFVGGFLARALFNDQSVGFIGSVIGAMLLLLLFRAVLGRHRGPEQQEQEHGADDGADEADALVVEQ